MAEQLSLAQIEASDVYVSEISENITFRHPCEYIQNFKDILEPLGATFTYEAELGAISKEREREDSDVQKKHISYKSLSMKAKLPEAYNLNLEIDSSHNNLWSEIGLVYNFANKNPELRVFRGKRVAVCTNLTVWGADNVTSINLAKSSTRTIFDSLKYYADNAANDLGKYREIIERLYNNKLSDGKLKERIGHILWECKLNNKLGITCASDMITYLQDGKSRYSLVDGATNDWNLYNACTESLKKSALIDEPNKVLFLDKIFNNN